MSETTSTRRGQVVQAAIGVFLRYGYARTTMAHIAQAAGLSRPTLYLTFPDKDAIFHAVVDAMVADKLSEIRQRLCLAIAGSKKSCAMPVRLGEQRDLS